MWCLYLFTSVSQCHVLLHLEERSIPYFVHVRYKPEYLQYLFLLQHNTFVFKSRGEAVAFTKRNLGR